MKSSHVTGAGLGALIASVLTGVFPTFSDSDAVLIGAAAVAAGSALAHVIYEIGVVGAAKVVVYGSKKGRKRG